ncbi:FeoA family protein [Acidimangrovimonas pyrenivorans]|uniref:Ferrous iron transport protein A n=1 Tax=Acidimangrovimonas pyrenivorans TaxID=2030798 RepID=A0ABV7AGC8_9RHOB
MTIAVQPDQPFPLGLAARGYAGSIHRIEVSEGHPGLPAIEIERRLIELGFVEGATVSVLHEGLFGRDPIAIRVNGATVALRRREAMAILTR